MDGRYVESAEALASHAGDLIRVERVEQTHDETLASLIAGSAAPAGFEAADLSVARHRWLPGLPDRPRLAMPMVCARRPTSSSQAGS